MSTNNNNNSRSPTSTSSSGGFQTNTANKIGASSNSKKRIQQEQARRAPEENHSSCLSDPALLSSLNMPSGHGENDDNYLKHTERKRSKEKKRRLDIANSIERLSDSMLKTDPTRFVRHNNQLYFRALDDGSTATITKIDEHNRTYNNRSTMHPPRHGGYLSSTNQNQALNRTEIITYAAQMIEKLAIEKQSLNLKLIQSEYDLLLARSNQQNTTIATNTLTGSTSSREVKSLRDHITDHALSSQQINMHSRFPLLSGYTPEHQRNQLASFYGAGMLPFLGANNHTNKQRNTSVSSSISLSSHLMNTSPSLLGPRNHDHHDSSTSSLSSAMRISRENINNIGSTPSMPIEEESDSMNSALMSRSVVSAIQEQNENRQRLLLLRLQNHRQQEQNQQNYHHHPPSFFLSSMQSVTQPTQVDGAAVGSGISADFYSGASSCSSSSKNVESTTSTTERRRKRKK